MYSHEHKNSNSSTTTVKNTLWYRVGNFYDYQFDAGWHSFYDKSYCNKIRSVKYHNPSYTSILNTIGIHCFEKGELVVELFANEIWYKQIHQELNKYFNTDKYERSFRIESEDDVKNFVLILEAMNTWQSKSEIEFTVIEDMIDCLTNQNLEHSVSEKDMHQVEVFPFRSFEKKDDNIVARYLGRNNKSDFSMKILDMLLKKGFPPSGHACWNATLFSDTSILEKLLVYGANPYEKQFFCNGFWSTKELLFGTQDEKYINCIQRFFTKPKKSLSSTKINLAKEIKISSDKKSITTTFFMEDKSVINATMKNAARMTSKELEEVYPLFCNYFITPENNEELRKKRFMEDFTSKDNFIHLVRDQKTEKLLGFNLFNIITPSNDLMGVQSICTAAEASFAGNGIMNFLVYRIPFALQHLNPKKFVFMVFFSMNYFSYSFAKNLLHYPKYVPDDFDVFSKIVIEKTYGTETKLQQDGLSCYIVDNSYYTKPNETKEENVSIDHAIFDKEFLGNKSYKQMDGKAVPIIFFAEAINNIILQTSFTRYQLDFSQHIQESLDYWKDFFPVTGQSKLLPSSVFWNFIKIINLVRKMITNNNSQQNQVKVRSGL